jgi:thiamine-monophosphate kinase
VAEFLIDRYLRPQPRVELGCRLAGQTHAVADISDGLVADMGHIAQASRVAATLEASQVPLSSAARAALSGDPTLMATVLTGGDDYELVFTSPPEASSPLARLADEMSVALTCVGSVAEGTGDEKSGTRVRVVDAAGREMTFSAAGYRHF